MLWNVYTFGSGSTAYPGNTSGVGWNHIKFWDISTTNNAIVGLRMEAAEAAPVRARRIRGGPQAEAGARYIRPRGARNDGGVQRPRLRYFQDFPSQRKYYGIKHQIDFQRQFPLRDFSYMPLRRGGEQSLNMYGATHKLATPDQRLTRARNLMTGKGLYRGRGGYWGRAFGNLFGLGDVGDKLGDMASTAISAVVPGGKQAMDLVSSDLGQGLGKLASDYTGKGMYNKRGRGLYRGRGAYSTNALITDSTGGASALVPQFGKDIQEIVYSNREYVRDVFAPATGTPFSIESWFLNPGLYQSFPWLAQIAVNFEEYELMQLIYTFKSTVADFASASGQVGQVVMATQYNPNSDPFADKEEMMMIDGGMSCKTTESMLHGIECDQTKNSGSAGKFVRIGNLPPTEDLKNYDLGRTSLAVLNVPSTYAGQQLGELWVSYTVKLRKPKIAALNAYNIQRDVYALKAFAVPAIGNIFYTRANLLAGARNSLGAAIVPSLTASTTLPVGAGTDVLTADAPTVNTITQAQQFQIVLPDRYSGVIKIHMRSFNHSAASNALWQIVSLAPQTLIRFQDIPRSTGITGTPGYTFTHCYDTYNDVAPGGGTNQSEVELHIRVLPPVNGLRNILCVGFQAALTVGHLWSIPLIELCQINTFLSVQDNGQNDRIDFVDFANRATLWS